MSAETSRFTLQPARLSRRLRRASLPIGATARRLRTALRAGYWAEFGLVTAILMSLVVVRLQLGSWQSDDYTMFLTHWFDYLRSHGFRGLGDAFANYNMPYLYLLFIGSRITPDGLAVVKVISALSDLALALGCFAVLRHLTAQRELAVIAAASTLLLPEVLLNSAAWGQADSTYGALLVWALWSALRGRASTTWVLYALAFSFKLQAAFVLPAFVVLHVSRRWGWRGPALAVGTVLATELPALVAGRSPASIASIYLDQATGFAFLTMKAPTLYALLPESEHDVLKSSGTFFALASVGLLSYVVLRAARRHRLSGHALLLFITALATLAPYTLPMMHERYFYIGNVFLFLYAIASRRLLPWAFAAQAVAVLAYTPFLFKMDAVLPLGQLALIEGAVLFVVIRELVRITGSFPNADTVGIRSSELRPAPADLSTDRGIAPVYRDGRAVDGTELVSTSGSAGREPVRVVRQE